MGSGGGLFGSSTNSGCAYGCCLISVLQGVLAVGTIIGVILLIVSFCV